MRARAVSLPAAAALGQAHGRLPLDGMGETSRRPGVQASRRPGVEVELE
ncbi:MAG: hypothetical protein ABGY24_09950 [bacterium]